MKVTLTDKWLITNNSNSNNDKNNSNNNNENNNDMKSHRKDVTDGSAKSLDFFQHNKSVKKIERKYKTTRIKFINFSLNISYIGIKK